MVVDGAIDVRAVDPDDELNGWPATHYFGRLGGREFLKMTEEENVKRGCRYFCCFCVGRRTQVPWDLLWVRFTPDDAELEELVQV